jgi:hypothetical protein
VTLQLQDEPSSFAVGADGLSLPGVAVRMWFGPMGRVLDVSSPAHFAAAFGRHGWANGGGRCDAIDGLEQWQDKQGVRVGMQLVDTRGRTSSVRFWEQAALAPGVALRPLADGPVEVVQSPDLLPGNKPRWFLLFAGLALIGLLWRLRCRVDPPPTS